MKPPRSATTFPFSKPCQPLNKQSSQNRKTPEHIDAAIRQLASKSITTKGQVIDVFTAAALP